MSELSSILNAEGTRENVIPDLAQGIENTVDKASGFTGMAIKSAYGSAKKKHPNLATNLADRFLPDLADTLDPYWQDFKKQGGSFADYLENHSDQLVEDMQKVTDQKVEEAGNPAVSKMHGMFRSKTAGFIKGAIPELAGIVEKHT